MARVDGEAVGIDGWSDEARVERGQETQRNDSVFAAFSLGGEEESRRRPPPHFVVSPPPCKVGFGGPCALFVASPLAVRGGCAHTHRIRFSVVSPLGFGFGLVWLVESVSSLLSLRF